MLRAPVDAGIVPGAVGLVVRDGVEEFAAVGSAGEGGPPMARDSVFRMASVTKLMTAAVVLSLVEDGLLGLHMPVERWLPELAAPMVVRTPTSPVDDVVPAVRPITVRHLLTSTTGWGFPSDVTLPAVAPLSADGIQQDGREVSRFLPPDEWLAALARVPLLHQPGETWLYNTSSDLQGVLIARATGRSLPEVMTERLFAPLGMTDTGFEVPEASRHRFTTFYRRRPGGALTVADRPDGQWSRLPAFASGAGGLVSTADDCLAFLHMLLAAGTGTAGHPVLSPASVRAMTTNHLTPTQLTASPLFLEGQGWGFGGTVDLDHSTPWNTPGRYGWVGGTGTTAHLTPSTGTVTILLTQVGESTPTLPDHVKDFWTYASEPRRGS